MPANEPFDNKLQVFVITEDFYLYSAISEKLFAQNCKSTLISDNKNQYQQIDTADFNSLINIILNGNTEPKYILFVISANENLNQKTIQY